LKFKNKKFFNNALIITYKNNKDNRGNFIKFYASDYFSKKIIKNSIFQINLSKTKKKGTIRGLHLQVNKWAEDKIITCLKGKIFDVIVDMRKKSKNYLKWKSIILSENKTKSLFVPKGFAHGFQALKDNTEVLYFHTNNYNKKYEANLNPLDKKIKITWPLKLTEISKKDKNAKFIK
jgi:dTDP-4-dehydrorhamnose 3,5-epimerase